MRARGRLDHSETDVLSRLSVEKQWVPRFTLASHEFVGHSRRSRLVLAYFTSCPRFLFRKRYTVQMMKLHTILKLRNQKTMHVWAFKSLFGEIRMYHPSFVLSSPFPTPPLWANSALPIIRKLSANWVNRTNRRRANVQRTSAGKLRKCEPRNKLYKRLNIRVNEE